MKTNKKEVGVICGSFDLIHAGYIRMFADAKNNACKKLIVALQSDPTLDRPSKNRCVQPISQRIEILESIRFVDEVLVYDTEKDLYQLLNNIDYDVRILGTDYKDRDYTGKDLDPSVYFHSRNHDISTTSLKKNIYNSMSEKAKL